MIPIAPLIKPVLNWKESLQQPAFRYQFALFLVIIIGIGLFFPEYFDYLEERDGILMNDFIVSRIRSRDVSWLVFFCLYSGIAIGVASSIRYPKICLMIMQTYSLVTLMRIITIFCIPLNPPEGYIALKEPLLGFFFTSEGKICSKDLFFSGHVSTIMAIYFPMKQKLNKAIVLVLTVLIGSLVLVQHVHYTVDVLAAPVATYACYLFSKKVIMKNIL